MRQINTFWDKFQVHELRHIIWSNDISLRLFNMEDDVPEVGIVWLKILTP